MVGTFKTLFNCVHKKKHFEVNYVKKNIFYKLLITLPCVDCIDFH